MTDLFLKMLNMSISATWLALAVLLLRLLLKKAPKWTHVLLWGLVAFRLLCPFTLESVLSLIPSAETIPPEILLDATPAIDSGIDAVNRVVNPMITESFTPSPMASANPLQIWIPIAAYIWCIGMAVMLLYTLFSYWHLHRRVRTAIRIKDNVFIGEHISSPFVLGILKPRIYLPNHMEEPDRFHVLAHERTHIHRGDHLWKPLGFLLLAIHWFNPILWIAYIALCRDIELACDEKVIRHLGTDQRADYSQALLNCSVSHRAIAACPLAFGEVGVTQRVKNVLHYKKPAFWMVLLSVILCIAAAVCFLTDPVSKEPDSPVTISADNTTGTDIALGTVTVEAPTPYSILSTLPAEGTRCEALYLEDGTGYVFHTAEDAELVGILNSLSQEDFVPTPGVNAKTTITLSRTDTQILLYCDGSMVQVAFDADTASQYNLRPCAVQNEALTAFIEKISQKRSAVSYYEVYNVAPLEELSDTYSLEEAAIDKVITLVDNDIRENQDVWDAFLADTKAGIPTEARFLHYRHSDTASKPDKFIFDVIFDGSSYTLRGRENNTIFEKTFRYLLHTERNSTDPESSFDAYSCFFLTNDPNASILISNFALPATAHQQKYADRVLYILFNDFITYPDYAPIPDSKGIALEVDGSTGTILVDSEAVEYLEQMFAAGEAMGYAPATYFPGPQLVFFGKDDTKTTITLDLESDIFIHDGLFYDYGQPDYPDLETLFTLFGWVYWPETVTEHESFQWYFSQLPPVSDEALPGVWRCQVESDGSTFLLKGTNNLQLTLHKFGKGQLFTYHDDSTSFRNFSYRIEDGTLHMNFYQDEMYAIPYRVEDGFLYLTLEDQEISLFSATEVVNFLNSIQFSTTSEPDRSLRESQRLRTLLGIGQ